MNLALFQELEAAISAVEPRVLEGYNPGLSDTEIDALMANVSFDLPDDLRALYRWKDGHIGMGFGGILGDLWWMAELTPSSETSESLRIEARDYFDLFKEIPPFDLEKTNFLHLFYDGCGYDLLACCLDHKTCEIRNRDKGGSDYSLAFRGVEPMIQTALEWWKSGVFYSPSEHQGSWTLEEDYAKHSEITRRLNPDCDYWWS